MSNYSRSSTCSSSTRSQNLMFRAAAPAALLLPLIASVPASADPSPAAEYAVTTCRSILEDPAKVEAVAKEQNWTAKPNPPPRAGLNTNGLKVTSSWVASRGDDKFMIEIASGPVPGTIGDSNVCTFTFPGAKLPRSDFFGVLSAALQLKLLLTATLAQGQTMEMFEIKTSWPAKQMLQLVSLTDGNVVGMNMMAVQTPDAPHP